MAGVTSQDFGVLADAYAFLGNSLLAPMNQTATVGLDPAFWREFPCFGSPAARDAADELAAWAQAGGERSQDKRVQDVSVEYTRLFVGPPTPTAPPWETMNRHEGVTVGFGEPTFQMRQQLRDAGLELSQANRQYEDHMGIELLYLSELCRRAAEGEPWAQQAAAFAQEHPLAWIDAFAAKVEQDAPDGYYRRLLALAKALLEAF